MSEIKESVADLIDFLKVLNRIKSQNPVYRGQSNIDWKLIPKISRKEYSLGDLRLYEKKILYDFKKNSGLFKIDASFIEVMTLGQHYGLATRLIDWTTNPLVALWFATDVSQESDGAVYLTSFIRDKDIDDNELDLIMKPFDPFITNYEIPFFYKPYHVDRRILNQSSIFSISITNHQFNYERDEEGGDYILPLEEIPKFKNSLIKLLIKNENKHKIRNELDLFGINKYFIYNDLNSLSEIINSKYM
jgi:hypothetical protein